MTAAGDGRRWRTALADEAGLVVHVVTWAALGTVAGALAGVSSWVFLELLRRVTDARTDHAWLVALLPLIGAATALVGSRLDGSVARGNSLIVEQIHDLDRGVPAAMAPWALAGTLLAHLGGASVGREGAAVQMSGSLTDSLARALGLGRATRTELLVAAVAGGFGAVFGVPVAGAVFALEVTTVGRVRYEGVVGAVAASITGHLVVEALGYEHPVRVALAPHLDAWLVARVALAAIVFGLVAAVFVDLTHLLRAAMVRRLPAAPVRAAIGGASVALLGVLLGRDLLGLSLPLLDDALGGTAPSPWIWAAKLGLTALSLAAGFPGGEVTPLFVVGATLGATLAGPLGLPVPVLAALGMVAVFAAASNTPLASTFIAVELFGAGLAAPALVACVVAYVISAHRSIYPTQRVGAPKGRLPGTGSLGGAPPAP